MAFDCLGGVGLPTNQENPIRTLLTTHGMNLVTTREPMRKSLPLRRLQIWEPEERDGGSGVIGQRSRPLPYTGPDTAAQLTALKYLQYVAAEQESAVDVDFVARRGLLFVLLALQAALSARLFWGIPATSPREISITTATPTWRLGILRASMSRSFSAASSR